MAPASGPWWWLPVLLSVALATRGRALGPTEGRRLTAGTSASRASTSTPSSSTDAPINRCREGCLAKYSFPDMTCSQTRACSTCWNDCSNSDIPRATSSAPRTCHLRLAVQRMVRNESLVAADVSWTVDGDCNPSASQCLVTWEVSGGGLMGNLLTESPSVQLSLWPDTNYRVQVTCRSKHTSFLMRSAPLILSTAGAVAVGSTSTTVRPLSEIAEGDDDEALARELDDDSRQTTNRLDPWPVARESEILALFVAMLLFLLVLLAVALLVKWRPASDRSEKDVLVDHEAMVEILHV